jgi:hypothetical protein
MMWTPLAKLFPSFFSIDHRADSYGSSAVKSPVPIATSRSQNNWTQLHAYLDSKGNNGVNQINDSQNRPSEDSTGQILLSSEVGEVQDPNANGIRRVTEYHVSYFNAKSPSS